MDRKKGLHRGQKGQDQDTCLVVHNPDHNKEESQIQGTAGWCQEWVATGAKHKLSSAVLKLMTQHFVHIPDLTESSQKSWELDVIIHVSHKEKLKLRSVK